MTSLQERTAVGRDFSSILEKVLRGLLTGRREHVADEDHLRSRRQPVIAQRFRITGSPFQADRTGSVDGAMIPILRCPD